MPRLLLNLLGPFTVFKDDQPISFSYDKVRALLAYLCVEHGKPVPRERLAGLLWPDQSQAAAQDSLRQAISRLRKDIDDREAQPPYLMVERDCLQLNLGSNLDSDLFQFQDTLARAETHHHRRPSSCMTCAAMYENAVRLIRGNFLEDLSLPDSDLYENWVGLLRERHQVQVLRILGTLVEYYERRGEIQHVLETTARQIAIDPYNEPAHRHRMLALARSGQRSLAVAQFQRLRRQLAEELGIDPSAETLELFEQIKTGQDFPDLNGSRVRGLPEPLVPLVGRKVELSELGIWLSDPNRRLISVVGPGGIGKTYLANQAVRQAAAMFADGVLYVPLASAGSERSLADALAAALRLPDNTPAAIWSRITRTFHEREMLLALDGFEHLLSDRERVSQLLRAHAGLVVLVTSRERLNLDGEWVFELGGLEVPPAVNTRELQAYSAVQLFCQCASQINHHFELNDANRAAIRDICRLVGGIPLAIRLACAWTRSLSCPEIAAEIARSLDLLSRQPGRTAEDPENSMRAAFEQSWRRLEPSDRQIFQRLSVFQAGFDRAAAQQIAEANLDHLSRLVDQSLLHMNPEGRYDLHDLLIQFGAEKLQQSGEEADIQKRHFDYFYTLSQENERRLSQGGSLTAFLWLIQESGNLGKSLAWGRVHAPAQAAEMIGWIHADFHQWGIHLI